MTTYERERVRVAFNHDWLKNRFLLILRRARQVKLARIIDDAVGDDLASLFCEWPERFSEVLQIFDDDSVAVKYKASELRQLFPDASDETIQWLGGLLLLRCQERGKEYDSMAAAERAIRELNREIQDFNSHLSIDSLLNCAMCASERLSELRVRFTR